MTEHNELSLREIKSVLHFATLSRKLWLSSPCTARISVAVEKKIHIDIGMKTCWNCGCYSEFHADVT